MQSYTLSSPAKKIFLEREIPLSVIEDTLWYPDQAFISKKDSTLKLNKKIYFHPTKSQKRLLFLFFRQKKGELFIVFLTDIGENTLSSS